MTSRPYRLPFHQTPEGCSVHGFGHESLTVAQLPIGLEAAASRALPGHRILRVPRFGRGIPTKSLPGILDALKEETQRQPTLRLHLEAWSESSSELEAVSKAALSAGFAASSPRSYTKTLWMDLRPDPDELLAGLHKTGRYNVRSLSKYPLEVRQITDTSYVPVLEALTSETMGRTDGSEPPRNWERWIQLGIDRPDLTRVLGVFRTDEGSPQPLLAFAVGVHHGDVAEYSQAASTRDTDLKASLLYAPVWELILWARKEGASWWDFGGVTPSDDEGPLSGISRFKRYFNREERDVGAEFMFEPSPWKARLARGIGRAAGLIGIGDGV